MTGSERNRSDSSATANGDDGPDTQRDVPTIRYDGERIESDDGQNLLRALPRDALSSSTPVSLCGNGICGMCTVTVEGETNDPTEAERKRLGAADDGCEGGEGNAPCDGDGDGDGDGDDRQQRRLACQTTVRGDLVVRRE
ncbi:2Fe-2S iron-sulfur cluster-binding protein [Halobiforma nitratireducens]|uniref:Ferredoxin n=1 Tax=Halobiforma nitratireducens JCM 10879 TaxID=1227454 RepID=M0L199_9EURY|nr:2Fe-2S iron-sulfur cluster binding domain-containing protein [Halobiforma nitratireducens]EMA27337.1 ferredoxin [Halobiforma nitratireducens JCM 10879]